MKPPVPDPLAVASLHVAVYGLIVAIVTLVVAFAALWLAGYSLRRSNRNTSAATVITLTDAFREAWERYFAAEGKPQEYALADLMNLIEVAGGILTEGSLAGVSQRIADNYLRDILLHIERNDVLLGQIAAMRDGPETFVELLKFISKLARAGAYPRLCAALAPAPAAPSVQ